MTLEPAKTHDDIPQQDWHALKAEDVLKHLEVHENGLTSEEAQQRLRRRTDPACRNLIAGKRLMRDRIDQRHRD